MKGVKFGGLHSFYEWGLILSEKEIKAPKPMTIELEIEGSDGVLDYTEFFGGVRYENRQLSFKFYSIDPEDFLTLFSTVQNAIHGKKMQVILDDDPAFFYYGRVTVNEWKVNKRLGEITIEVDAEPYKQSITETVASFQVSSSANIVLENDQKPVIPTITTTTEMLIDIGSFNESYPAGTFQMPELELTEGGNQVYIEGTGKITFRYRKGRL